MVSEQVKGQVVKIQTTADECIRVTVDIDAAFIPEGVNVLKWKNNMVEIRVIESTPEKEIFKWPQS